MLLLMTVEMCLALDLDQRKNISVNPVKKEKNTPSSLTQKHSNYLTHFVSKQLPKVTYHKFLFFVCFLGFFFRILVNALKWLLFLEINVSLQPLGAGMKTRGRDL